MILFDLSRQTLRHGRAPYAGSFIALFLGVGLIGVTAETIAAGSAYQSGLSAADTAGRAKLDDLMSALGVMSGFSGFMAIFVVASTFSFVVSSRRRELALLRLVGATPRQIRRMIMGESLLVALAAGLAGCVLAQVVEPAVLRLIAEQGLTPHRMGTPPPWPAFAVALPVGVVVALIGAWAAARRASRTRPIDALREASAGTGRLGFWRVACGVVFLAGSGVLLFGIGAVSGEFSVVLGIFVPEMLVIALVCLGPVLIPGLVRLIALPLGLRGNVTIRMARDNVVAYGKRTASLAAPTLAISAITGSMIVTLGIAADWDNAITRAELAAPIVVEANGDPTAGALMTGADAVVPFEILLHHDDEKPDPVDAEAIDVGTAVRARGLTAYAGRLNDLRGNAIAMSRTDVFDNGRHIGDPIGVTMPDGTALTLRLAVIVEDAPTLHANVLVPAALAREHAPHATAERWFVLPRGDPGSAVTALNRRFAGARAELATTWIARHDAAQRASNSLSIWILLGPAGLYSALAIANTLLMGSLRRRREFVATRLIGATGRQIRRMILGESVLVTLAALALGGTTTFIVGLSIGRSLGRGLTGMSITVPWPALAEIAAVCLTVAATAALVPAAFILRRVHPSEAAAE
jgi:putative ABC transport system permease protein